MTKTIEAKEKFKFLLRRLGLFRFVYTIKVCCFESNLILGLFRYYFKHKKQIVLMTGCMRTGSTLLKALLAEAEDVSHLSEIQFGRYADTYPQVAIYSIYALSVKPIIVLKRPVQLIGNTTIYNNIPFESSFLKLKVIITMRNPYNTIMSIKNMWPERTYPDLIEYCCNSMEMILTDKKLFSHDVLFVKYEDLVKDSITQTERIFKFINSRRTQGANTYGTAFKWEIGKDDSSEKIKIGKVQENKNTSRDEELSQLLKNHKRIIGLSKRFGYSEF